MQEQPSVRPERTITWRVRRVSRQGVHEGEIVVAGEEPLEVRLNGQPIAVLMRLPGDEKELAAGFCLSEGYVRRSDDLLMVHHCGSAALGPDDPLESSNRVEVTARPEALVRPLEMTRLILSGCGSTGSAAAAAQLAADLPPLQSDLHVRQEVLLGLAQALVAAQGVHKQTGGVHAAALFTSTGELLVLREAPMPSGRRLNDPPPGVMRAGDRLDPRSQRFGEALGSLVKDGVDERLLGADEYRLLFRRGRLLDRRWGAIERQLILVRRQQRPDLAHRGQRIFRTVDGE